DFSYDAQAMKEFAKRYKEFKELDAAGKAQWVGEGIKSHSLELIALLPWGKILPLLKAGSTVAKVQAVNKAIELETKAAATTSTKIVSEGVKEVAGIKSFTEHAVNRAIERGVSPKAILDTLKNPLKIHEVKIDNLGRASQRLIGKEAEVVVNPTIKK